MQPERKTIRKICLQCGREFLAYKSSTNCCSDRCSNLADKHRKRDERLKRTSIEVRELQRLALLDKNYLTLSDAAKLMQLSRNTLYKIIQMHSIQLHRFTGRTIRIARADLDKIGVANIKLTDTSISKKEEILNNWITREEVMKLYEITHSWFYSTIKKHKLNVKTIGCKAFYDKKEMDKLFKNQDYSYIREWYTFKELQEMTGMRTESISEYCTNHKIPRAKKNGVTYVSKTHWDSERGSTLDPVKYITIKEIVDIYKLSRNHLFTIFKEYGIDRIKKGNFVYFNREEVDKILRNRKRK